MIAICRCAAIVAAAFCMSALPAAAQQSASEAHNPDGYKPPARFVAKPGEAKPQKSAPGKSANATKTVGLISLIGETFTVKKIGIMVFGNEEDSFPIAGWKIDDRVAASVSHILKKNFRVKRIQIPSEAYTAYKNGDFFLKSYDDEFAKFLAKYTNGQGCDYYLVISPYGAQVASTNQYIGGLGVLRWSNLFNPPEQIHALSLLTVYDGQMKELRSERGSIGQDSFLVAIRGPYVELKDQDMLPPEPKAAVADPRAQKIVWELLDQSLAKTVPKLLSAD